LHPEVESSSTMAMMLGKTTIFSIIFAIFLGVLRNCYLQSPLRPVAVEMPPLPTTPANESRLVGTPKIFENDWPGAEHVTFHCDKKNKCTGYSGLADGRVVAFNPDAPEDGYETLNRTGCVSKWGCPRLTREELPADVDVPVCGELKWEDVCGRPLGLTVSEDGGTLLVADAYFGILAVTLLGEERGELSVVASHYLEKDSTNFQTRKILKLPNSIQVVKTGALYFTHTTDNWERRTILLDLLETSPGGKVMKMDNWRNKLEETPRVIWNSLVFANGLLVDQDEKFALVAETAMARIKRLDMATSKVSVAVENVPCTIDNLAWEVQKDGVSRDQKGVWLGCAVRRVKPFALIDFLASSTGFRRFLGGALYFTGTSHFMYKLVPKTGMAIKMEAEDDARTLVLKDANIYIDPKGAHVPGMAQAVPFKGKLYMGSHKAEYKGLAVYSLKSGE